MAVTHDRCGSRAKKTPRNSPCPPPFLRVRRLPRRRRGVKSFAVAAAKARRPSSIHQIHNAQNRERHRVVHHAISVEVADHVARRRWRQITQQVRRQWPEVPAIAKRYVAADHKHRPSRAVDVTKIPPVVSSQVIPIVRPPMIWRSRRRWPSAGRTRRPISRLPRLRARRRRPHHRTPRLPRRWFSRIWLAGTWLSRCWFTRPRHRLNRRTIRRLPRLRPRSRPLLRP